MSAKNNEAKVAARLNRRKINHQLRQRPNNYVGISKPKYSKRANAWVVTINDETQKQHWFDNEEDAVEFYRKIN